MIQAFYIKVIFPAKSFLFNCIYWLWHIGSYKQFRKERKALAEKAKTIEDIKTIMQEFTWKEDRTDWQQWVTTLLHNDKHGDCEDAANLAKFLFKQINMPGKIYNLYGQKTGHAIFVTDDLSSLVSNSEVSTGDAGKWTDSRIKLHFNLRYNRIIK
jgi:hypothetical protein